MRWALPLLLLGHGALASTVWLGPRIAGGAGVGLTDTSSSGRALLELAPRMDILFGKPIERTSYGAMIEGRTNFNTAEPMAGPTFLIPLSPLYGLGIGASVLGGYRFRFDGLPSGPVAQATVHFGARDFISGDGAVGAALPMGLYFSALRGFSDQRTEFVLGIEVGSLGALVEGYRNMLTRGE